MRIVTLILLLCSLLSPQALFAYTGSSSGLASNIDLLLERAISQNLIAGGVVVVGNREGIISSSARGQLSSLSDAPPINDRTVFDVASLTKVIATTPAIIKLLDDGLIKMSDPISRWFPEFSDAGKGEITVLHLMTHTSGLRDFMLSSDRSMQGAIERAAAQQSGNGPGTDFKYADINFILLGELVHRVSGKALDAFCQEQIYRPLGTRETLFLPPGDLASDVAPTSGTNGGVVQDQNARRLGGVAGHAGLFSSAYDLSRFARLMLGGGVIDGKRILSEQVVTQMTSSYLCNGGDVRRGLGWDIASPYSAPRGSFLSDSSFGHTGYSGSSIWIDPDQDLFVILLTRRVDYRHVKNFNQLRRDVSTIAAADFIVDYADAASLLEMNRIKAQVLHASTVPVKSSARVTRVAAGGGKATKQMTKVAARSNKVVGQRGKVVASSSKKWLKAKQAAQCAPKSDKQVAKAGARRRAGSISSKTKDKAGKTVPAQKKRRTLPKS